MQKQYVAIFPLLGTLLCVISIWSFFRLQADDTPASAAGLLVVSGSSYADVADPSVEVLKYPWLDYAAVWRALATDIPLHPRDYHLPQSCRQAIEQGRSTCPAISAYLAVGFDSLRESMEAFTALGSSCLAADLGERKRWCDQAPQTILILPCAYGREVRAFHAAFPNSQLYVADFNQEAANWTSSVFGIPGVFAGGGEPMDVVKNLAAISAPKFQLIWMGNLLTRLSERTAIKWLRTMIEMLDWNGVVVFTFYGPLFHEWETLNQTGTKIAESSLMDALKANFKKSMRYGFVKRERAISCISTAWIEELPRRDEMKDAKVSLVYLKNRAFGPHRLQGVAAFGRKYLAS